MPSSSGAAADFSVAGSAARPRASPATRSGVAADIFVGSLAAEFATKALVHPFDTLKTRLQYLVLPKRTAGSAAHTLPLVSDVRNGIKMMADAARSPHHSLMDPSLRPAPRSEQVVNGLRSLYRGLGPQLLGVVPISLVYMPTYEYVSAALQGTPLQHTPLAGVITGVASAVVRVPVRGTRQQPSWHGAISAMCVFPPRVSHLCQRIPFAGCSIIQR